MRCLAALVLLLLLAPLSPTAALADGEPGDLWYTYTVADGIASGNVSAVYYAQDGTLWFGTETGASHYDGHWVSLSEKDGLPAGRVRAVTGTSDGSLWFGTKTGGLAQRSAAGACCRVWTTGQQLPSNDVRALLPAVETPGAAGEMALWVGTSQGLVRLTESQVTPEAAMAGIEIWSLAAGPAGELLAGTSGRGVWSRDALGAWEVLGDALPGDVYAVKVEADGGILAGTQAGLFRYDAGAWRLLPLPQEDGGLTVFSILEDDGGGLWVGSDQGLFHIPDGGPAGATPTQFRADRPGLVSNYVRAMVFDGDGELWLGTLAGVSRYDGRLWQTVHRPPLQDQRINAILTDGQGWSWVGTEQNGLALWDGATWQSITEDNGLPDNRVVSLYEDNIGRVWVGTGTGVGYRTPDQKWRFFTEADGLAGAPVWSIAQDEDGGFWLGTEAGASYLDGAGVLNPVARLDGKRVNAIHRDNEGTLWFGLPDDGLMRLAGDQWQAVPTPAGTSFEGILVNGIQETPISPSSSALWVATGNDGLWQCQDGHWRRMDGFLASPLVLSLGVLDGQLWVGTRQGFDRYDGRTWQSYSGAALPSPEITAIGTASDGAAWIGTTGGLVHYRPERTRPWMDLERANLQPPMDGALTLVGGRLRSIRLSGGDLATQPEDIVFLTQLEGVDPYPRPYSDRLAPYEEIALAPGTYALRAWARDSSLNYSPPTEVKVIVPRVVTLFGTVPILAGLFYPALGVGVLAAGGFTLAVGLGKRARPRGRPSGGNVQAAQQEAPSRGFNPYISGEPIRQSDMFFGRQELLGRILNALHLNSIMLYGERRIGKTTLLYQLVERLRRTDDPDWVFIPVLIDLEGTSQERFFHSVVESAACVVGPALPGVPRTLRASSMRAELYTDRDAGADLKVLLEALEPALAPRRARLVLMLDEVDVLNGYSPLIQQQLRRMLMSPLMRNVGAVMAGAEINKAWDRVESPWYNLFTEVAVEPFSEEQSRALLTDPVRGVYEWDPAAVDHVLQQAQGRPFRLQQYALEAVNRMLTAGRLRITMSDVAAADQTIDRAGGG